MMGSVSTTTDALTESRGLENQWEKAVPVSAEVSLFSLAFPIVTRKIADNQKSFRPPYKSRVSNEAVHTRQNTRTPLSSSSNPSLNRKSSREVNRKNSKEGNAQGTDYLTPARVEELNKRGNDMSRTGSEPDSLLDLYQQTPDRSTSTINYEDAATSNGKVYHGDEDLDNEKWIHRDKLARIESEEMQAAGIDIPAKRSSSKSRPRREQSYERHSTSTNGTGQESWPSAREEKRQRISSPVAEEQEPEQQTWNPRSPTEKEADLTEERNASGVYENAAAKKSKSRIPVLASSPLPVQDRETPRQRKRTISGGSPEGEPSPIFRSHNRHGSAGSQTLLEDFGGSLGSPVVGSIGQSSKNGSPKKKTPASNPTSRKATPASRKTSNVRAPSTSNNSPAQRTTAKVGDDRPRTAVNRPEGDPPWLATMYKPDPMLPPDQQIIPTLAKRQQAAQWTDEGAIVKIYDRDFSPLAVHTQEGLQRPPNPPTKPSVQPALPSPEKQKQDTWPLQPISRTTSTNSRPGSRGTDRGGYSTMPKVASSPLASTLPSPIASAPPVKVQQQPIPPELPAKKEKSCGCCTVM
ncbi:MAG: hypothetical protein Q9160_007220 [Pyrenula sp. 1 TL-2023]